MNKLLIHFIISLLLINSSYSAPLEIEIEEVGSENEVELTIVNNTDHGIPYTARLMGGFLFSIGLKGAEKTIIISGSLSEITTELSPRSRAKTKINFSAERFHIQPNNAYEMNVRWGDVHLGREGVTIADLSLTTDEANHISITTTDRTKTRYHPANAEVSAQIKGTNVPVPEIKGPASSSASVALELKAMKSEEANRRPTDTLEKIALPPSGSSTLWQCAIGIFLFSVMLVAIHFLKRRGHGENGS